MLTGGCGGMSQVDEVSRPASSCASRHASAGSDSAGGTGSEPRIGGGDRPTEDHGLAEWPRVAADQPCESIGAVHRHGQSRRCRVAAVRGPGSVPVGEGSARRAVQAHSADGGADGQAGRPASDRQGHRVGRVRLRRSSPSMAPSLSTTARIPVAQPWTSGAGGPWTASISHRGAVEPGHPAPFRGNLGLHQQGESDGTGLDPHRYLAVEDRGGEHRCPASGDGDRESARLIPT